MGLWPAPVTQPPKLTPGSEPVTMVTDFAAAALKISDTRVPAPISAVPTDPTELSPFPVVMVTERRLWVQIESEPRPEELLTPDFSRCGFKTRAPGRNTLLRVKRNTLPAWKIMPGAFYYQPDSHFGSKCNALLNVSIVLCINHICRIAVVTARNTCVWRAGVVVVVDRHRIRPVESFCRPLLRYSRARRCIILRPRWVADCTWRHRGDQMAGDRLVEGVPSCCRRPIG